MTGGGAPASLSAAVEQRAQTGKQGFISWEWLDGDDLADFQHR